MNIQTMKRAANAALVLMLAIGAGAAQASAETRDLGRFLVGKWRQPTTYGVTETVFDPRGAFKSTMYVGGSHDDPAYLSGGWEIRRGNELWTHNMAWYPIYVRHYDGSKTPISIPAWGSTTVEVIDANHIRMNGGVATRVTR